MESGAYSLMLLLHSWLRWGVVVSAVAVVALAVQHRRGTWSRNGDLAALLFLVTSGGTLVTGFLLYFFLTSWVSALVAFPEQVLAARGMRFWAVEHTAATAAALALTHFGRLRVLASPVEEKARIALLWFGGALALILLSMPWPIWRFGRPLLRW
jgi:hypothetical protein